MALQGRVALPPGCHLLLNRWIKGEDKRARGYPKPGTVMTVEMCSDQYATLTIHQAVQMISGECYMNIPLAIMPSPPAREKCALFISCLNRQKLSNISVGCLDVRTRNEGTHMASNSTRAKMKTP